jgi:hypothetical protein
MLIYRMQFISELKKIFLKINFLTCLNFPSMKMWLKPKQILLGCTISNVVFFKFSFTNTLKRFKTLLNEQFNWIARFLVDCRGSCSRSSSKSFNWPSRRVLVIEIKISRTKASKPSMTSANIKRKVTIY